MSAIVAAVSRSGGHTLVKPSQDKIRLLVGLGVEGDAHAAVRVEHRSRLARFASQPNLRQVHLIHAELHDELRARGFAARAGQMGENATTRGIDLLGPPTGARLCLGGTAVIAGIARGGVHQGAQLGGTQRQPGKISVPGPHTPPEIRVH